MKNLYLKFIKKGRRVFLIFDTLFGTRMYQKLNYYYLKKSGVKLYGSIPSIQLDSSIDLSGQLSIGDNVTISKSVIILTHDYSVTKALISSGKKIDSGVAVIKPVTIGNNVFIGAGSIILCGSQIGNNVIIGAGTVVRGKIPDNVVVTGNPCKIIRSIQEHCDIQEKYNSKYFVVDSYKML